jgi:hypothetical protein
MLPVTKQGNIKTKGKTKEIKKSKIRIIHTCPGHNLFLFILHMELPYFILIA